MISAACLDNAMNFFNIVVSECRNALNPSASVTMDMDVIRHLCNMSRFRLRPHHDGDLQPSDNGRGRRSRPIRILAGTFEKRESVQSDTCLGSRGTSPFRMAMPAEAVDTTKKPMCSGYLSKWNQGSSRCSSNTQLSSSKNFGNLHTFQPH